MLVVVVVVVCVVLLILAGNVHGWNMRHGESCRSFYRSLLFIVLWKSRHPSYSERRHPPPQEGDSRSTVKA